METTGITTATPIRQYERLHHNDIIKLPSLGKNNIDYFIHTNQAVPKNTKQTFLRKLFTALTFGFTGLYIAHKNNLFNPIRREAKKIVTNQKFKSKIKNLVDSSINEETFVDVTKKLLSKISKDTAKNSKSIMLEANDILNNQERFSRLFKDVQKKLSDDKGESLKNGYMIDLMDNFAQFFEQHLNKRKNSGLNIKNQAENLINSTFAESAKEQSKAKETLYEIISNRINSTVENFIKTAISDKSVL